MSAADGSADDPEVLLREWSRRVEQGADEASISGLDAAVQMHPSHAGLWTLRGDALRLLRRFDAAVDSYGRAIELDPGQFHGWYGLGGALLARGANGAARDALVRALVLDPGAQGARCLLAEALFELGETDAAVAAYREAADVGGPDVRRVALRNLALAIPMAPGADHARVLATRREWARSELGEARPRASHARSGGRIRVGYLSAFFGARNWMKPVYGVVNCHDRSRFEVHLISDGEDPSAAAGYDDHPDDRVWQVRGASNETLARHVAAAGIDVLVDLNGYSFPDRLGLFPLRAAPRQLGWFNMFATTAVPGFDALIGDHESVAPEEEPFYDERVLRVPGTYLAFRVRYPTPPVAAAPWGTRGHPTLGCLCSAYKLTPPTLDAWAGVLRDVPEARLVLRNATLDEESNRAALLSRLAWRGVDPARVDVRGRAEHFEFLRTYDDVDVALDTFPYNGGTTTTEAVWQGVPVLTCDGDRWAGRTSRSILRAAGLGGWVAADRSAFVAEGVRLLRDPATPGRLAELRSGMRARLVASPACDTAGLCAALEAIYAGEPAPTG